ncbi:SDR family NAD(P)-dependent oxidoreductase [Pseudooctadecabacter jejudonensis]|uniref:C-factor n=1 Tax=Pseudooctadecabacter jejudonensis TaxID=1391910 RepID=A0A1Y5SV28_9RHOB|nr:SDR family NAD(P)-dependent oxidoreductase [Pseudooctadecabacter jejudonensis]SLN49082.1 C-factor [Pseudooctadecabacter jejudonensis]
MHALITGASRGIGAQMTAQLEARGDTVTAVARNGRDMSVDVGDAASIHAMAEAFGDTPLDLLVCNAGVYHDKGHQMEGGFPAQMWADTFAVNVTGVFLCVQALLPNLKAVGGKIAIISSQMGASTKAGGGAYIYRASKAAASNLAFNLATDLRADGIAVGAYHPGWVQTDMGGREAAVTPADSAAGLIARFDALNMSNTGLFETYDGQAHPA